MRTTATVALGAALLTGVGAQLGLLDTSRVRWVHHALYAATLASVGATITTAGFPVRFLPVTVALAGLTATRGGSRRHAATAGVVALSWAATRPGGAHRGAR